MRFFLFIFPLLLIAAPLHARTLPYLDSVPLMEAFQVSDEDILIFDKPEGRIVEVMAWCEAECPAPTTITDYYKNALLPLGWASTTENTFIKGQSELSIDVQKDADNNQTIILFRENN